ncbi:MAG: DUF5676 family membrane protein [Pseudohongiellaceae bacterium]
MKLNTIKFGLAAAYAASLFWIICSLLVAILPGISMRMGGYMVHADLTGMNWSLGILGFVVGLLMWALSAGIFAAATAAIYNNLVSP